MMNRIRSMMSWVWNKMKRNQEKDYFNGQRGYNGPLYLERVRRQKRIDSIFSLLSSIAIGSFIALIFGGYALNIFKLVKLDFEAPYKAEIIRTVGVFVPPAGIVAGWMTIGDRSE